MSETVSTAGAENTTPATAETAATETAAAEQTASTTNEDFEKAVQRGIDKAMAAERKKTADLQKKYDRLAKEKLSEDEQRKIADEERAKELDEREKALTDKENRLFAVKAIKEAGLDDGSDTALEIVDIVITGADDTEETITAKVKTVSNLVKKLVAAEVDKTFKANGRVPKGADVSGKETETSVAAKLGKQRAAQNKQANDVLSYYTGGKK